MAPKAKDPIVPLMHGAAFAPDQAMVPSGPQALAEINDLIEDSGKGTENITSDDVRPPVLRVCQGQSPQRKAGNPKQIPGLNEPNLFNDLTGTNYGNGPLRFVVVSQLGESAVAFPNDKDPEAPDEIVFDIPVKRIPGTKKYTDARLNFRENGDKPIATKFVNYLVFLLESQELVALSLKGSQLKSCATPLNSLLKYPLSCGGQLIGNPPSWARVFELSTFMDKKDNQDFSATSVRAVGLTPPTVRALARSLHAQYATKRVVVGVEGDAPVVEDGEIPY